MHQQPKDQFEQQYNDSLNGDPANTSFKQDDGYKIKNSETSANRYEPMSEAQRLYLQTLMELHGETFNDNLTKAEAGELIDQKKQNISIPPPNEPTGDFWHPLKNPDNSSTS